MPYNKPRNPVIARLFHWAKLSENVGFGFDKMLVWKYKVGFDVHIDYSEVTFNLGDGGEKVGEMIGESEIQRKIIQLMLEQPKISAKQIGEMVGMTSRGVQKNIDVLKKIGLVERVGAARGGHWIVKPLYSSSIETNVDE